MTLDDFEKEVGPFFKQKSENLKMALLIGLDGQELSIGQVWFEAIDALAHYWPRNGLLLDNNQGNPSILQLIVEPMNEIPKWKILKSEKCSCRGREHLYLAIEKA